MSKCAHMTCVVSMWSLRTCKSPSSLVSRQIAKKSWACIHNLALQSKTIDERTRLSNLFAPTGTVSASAAEKQTPGHQLLLHAGFIRTSSAGVFHFLPMAVRVQDKLERAIDIAMHSLGIHHTFTPMAKPQCRFVQSKSTHTIDRRAMENYR